MGKGIALTEVRIKRIVEHFKSGKSVRDIATMYDYSTSTVYKAIKEKQMSLELSEHRSHINPARVEFERIFGGSANGE